MAWIGGVNEHTPPRFRLHTLGTLRLVDTTGSLSLGDHGHHRRRLALLAVLAASGERGRSRDHLLGLFWPEATQARARHSLEQLLYALRTALDAPVFSGVNPLLLNPAVVDSDIADFYSALARGVREKAVASYAGPFLDGFYLEDSPEFEQWVDAERRRADEAYTGALESLATAAETAGDTGGAVKWRQRLTQSDPLSARHAVAFMQALVDAGDHSAALQHAERYESAMASQLGTGPGPEVTAFANEVRRKIDTGSLASSGKPAAVQRDLPPALPIAAVNEEGSVVTARENKPILKTGRRLALLAAGALVFAIIAISGWFLRGTRGTGAAVSSQSSLAVLPLANLSGDVRDGFLADGITEELIGVLARIEGLRVVARTSAFAFRSSGLGVGAIADSLRVSHVLEGGVQRLGDRLRVQLRLIDAADGATLWSEVYDRDLKDVFAVQREIAGAVAQQLHLRLMPAARAPRRDPPTNNLAAYELVLRANDPALLRSDSSAALALRYFSQAALLDSNYAAAHAGVARMHIRLSGSALLGGSSLDKHIKAEQAATRAVTLDPSLADAQATLGLVRLGGGEFEGAEEALTLAVRLDPSNSRIREWLSFLYQMSDRPHDALAQARRAVENDPLSPSAHAELGRALCLTGRVDEGLARLRTVDALQPPLARARSYMAQCHGVRGDWQAASEVLPRSNVRIGGALLGHVLARLGKTDSAHVLLGGLMDHWKQSRDGAFLIAMVYAGLGDKDQTFEWLNRSVDEGSLSPWMMNPLFDQVKDDPRYEEFRRRLGLQKR